MVKRLSLAIVRIWLGYHWLSAAQGKLGSPAWTGEDAGSVVSAFLGGALAKAQGTAPEVHRWYAYLVENYMLPNARLFSFLVAYGEFMAGIALVLGALTWVAAAGSVFMNLNYLWAGTSGPGPEMLVAGVLVAVFAGAAGQYGLDGAVTRLRANWRRQHDSVWYS